MLPRYRLNCLKYWDFSGFERLRTYGFKEKEDEDILKKDFFEKSLACQEKILYTLRLFVYDNQGDRNGKNIGTDITV